MKYGEDAPFELVRWQMAERFGWTLEYIDSLPIGEVHQMMQVDHGRVKARK